MQLSASLLSLSVKVHQLDKFITDFLEIWYWGDFIGHTPALVKSWQQRVLHIRPTRVFAHISSGTRQVFTAAKSVSHRKCSENWNAFYAQYTFPASLAFEIMKRNYYVRSSQCEIRWMNFNQTLFWSSILKMKQQVPPKRWHLSTELHCVTVQKALKIS
jgi:hypothetical protein